MVDVYESTTSSSTTFLDIEYVKSLDSVCKIIEMVLGLCTFICACVWGTWRGGGWVQFVGIFSVIVIAIYFILKISRLVHKLPEVIPVTLVELITCLVFSLFYFIAGIVAAAIGQYDPSIAAAVFSFFNLAAFGADAFLKFQEWRSGGGGIASFSSSQTTTTTTTTTTMEQGESKY